MINLLEAKRQILSTLHAELTDATAAIAVRKEPRGDKAKAVNSLIGEIRNRLTNNVGAMTVEDKPNYALVLQYCSSVASLEYRHKVWPYEYMAFSRRVGELWESFLFSRVGFPEPRRCGSDGSPIVQSSSQDNQ